MLNWFLVNPIKKDLTFDEYVKTCQKLGREMQKVYKGVFNVRISPKLHKLVYQSALKNNISLNALVGKSLEKYIRN